MCAHVMSGLRNALEPDFKRDADNKYKYWLVHDRFINDNENFVCVLNVHPIMNVNSKIIIIISTTYWNTVRCSVLVWIFLWFQSNRYY